MTYKDPHTDFNRILQNIFLLFVVFFKNFKFFSKYFIALGYSFKLIDFAKNYNFDLNFEQAIFVGLRREKIYEKIIKKINIENNNIELALEFGVAWGYSTNYFLSNIKKNISWHGFDSFFGLPSNWHEYKKGHFGTQGKPPRIEDHRLTWNIGNISAGAGYTQIAKQIYFQVEVLPSISQKGKKLDLLDNVSFTAKDTFTRTNISRSVNQPTTSIRGYPIADAHENVVE